ncbi:MAG: TIGR00159 family protein [Cytophagales bacterium]|nr:MAG: TIGR00159 family protein [Cytophagales bacterium]
MFEKRNLVSKDEICIYFNTFEEKKSLKQKSDTLSLLFHIGFLEIAWVDVVDIALVSVLLFQLYKLAKGTVALKIFVGFLVLYLIFLMVQATQMKLLAAILDQFMGVGMLAALILFQQEIRNFLLFLGKSTDIKGFDLFSWAKDKKQYDFKVTPIADALKSLSENDTGALIVISKNSALSNYADTGDLLDAEISKRLLLAIFNKESPLHDGAVLIVDGRIKAARCIMPVSQNPDIPATMGLRHRAALGISEITDVLVLVVSEQTGQISIIQNGEISEDLPLTIIRQRLNEYVLGEQDSETSKAELAPH